MKFNHGNSQAEWEILSKFFIAIPVGAFSRTELLAIMAGLLLLGTLGLPAIGGRLADRTKSVQCINNLRQIGIANHNFAIGHGQEFPPAVPITYGGSQGMDLVKHYRTMTNDLISPRVVTCPADANASYANNWQSLQDSQISYFVGTDATWNRPETILGGDSNLTGWSNNWHFAYVNTTQVNQIGWSSSRHERNGNVLLTDGSVLECSATGLRQAILRSRLPNLTFLIYY